MGIISILTLITLVPLGILFISYFINGYYNDTIEILRILGYVLLVFIILIGWIAIGTSVTNNTKTTKIPFDNYQILKGEQSIILDDFYSDMVYYFNKKVDFDNITDSTTFYCVQGFSLYGNKTDTEMYYEVDDKKHYSKIFEK